MFSSVWFRTLASVALICAVPLVVTMLLARSERLVRAILPALLAVGVGVLLASAGLQLIPEALEHRSGWFVAALTAMGFALFAGMEHLLEQHDHGHVHGLAMGVPSHEHPPGAPHGHDHGQRHGHDHNHAARALLPMAFGADVLHNFLDGILVAASFLVRPELGLVTAIAIGLHELPRELGTFSLFVHGGLTPRRAVLFNALTAVFALAGAIITLLVGQASAQLAVAVLPLVAGSMVYIAFTVGRSVLFPGGGRVAFGPLPWIAAGGALVGLLVVLGAA